MYEGVLFEGIICDEGVMQLWCKPLSGSSNLENNLKVAPPVPFAENMSLNDDDAVLSCGDS